MTKTARIFHFSYTLQSPAQDVWNLLHDRYCDVADYANEILTSHSVANAPSHGEGAQRKCNFDETGSKYLHEELTDVDINAMRLTNKIISVGKLPIEPEVSKSIFTVKAQTPHSCVVDVEFHVRTKPAFLSLIMKGPARKQMGNLFVGAEHYLRTSQKITRENFKTIRKAAG